TPKEMTAIPGVRLWRRIMILTGLAFVLGFPFVTSVGSINLLGSLIIEGIAILSLVVLTGWAGQVSLAQWGLVGLGAVMGALFTSKFHLSFWLALIVVPTAVAGFAILVGLPALRIKGLFLAVATYAMAFAIQASVFNQQFIDKLIPTRIDRPKLFIFDFEDEKSMYFLALSALLLMIWLVVNLRKSRFGRILIALRENDNNVQSFGIGVVRTKLLAFALSGFMCGFAGVLWAHHQRAVTPLAFTAFESLNVFIFAVIGGVGAVSGAVLGTAYYVLSKAFGGGNPLLTLVIGPIGLLLVLYAAPGGLGSILYSLRDSVLRIVATRRQIVVPSLFADVDPAALELRLAPLADPIPSMGLSVLPFSQRYRTRSELYKNRGRIAADTKRAPDDKIAIGAAAKSLGGEE
ncbi:MAG: branched-chain amino acid ABC transporter permease, partial [Actinomycetota bacterium]